MIVNPLIHHFYSDDQLLFSLESAAEYDTATPYRYAVSRFVTLADRIKNGQPITVITTTNQKQTAVLQTVEELWYWISFYFSGFERYVLPAE